MLDSKVTQLLVSYKGMLINLVDKANSLEWVKMKALIKVAMEIRCKDLQEIRCQDLHEIRCNDLQVIKRKDLQEIKFKDHQVIKRNQAVEVECYHHSQLVEMEWDHNLVIRWKYRHQKVNTQVLKVKEVRIHHKEDHHN